MTEGRVRVRILTEDVDAQNRSRLEERAGREDFNVDRNDVPRRDGIGTKV